VAVLAVVEVLKAERAVPGMATCFCKTLDAVLDAVC
jgi:hypothetical protein